MASKRKDLATLQGVAQELGRIYEQIDEAAEPADNSETRLRTHVLSAIREVLQQSALEAKLGELEAIVKARFEIKRVG